MPIAGSSKNPKSGSKGQGTSGQSTTRSNGVRAVQSSGDPSGQSSGQASKPSPVLALQQAQSSSTLSSNPQLPPGTSFLFSIDEITPNYNVQDRMELENGWWWPPDRWDAFDPRNAGIYYPTSTVWRWEDGNITSVNLRNPPYNVYRTQLHSHNASPFLYRAATVVTLCPDNQHFLSVDFDARRENITQSVAGKWLELGFEHISLPTAPGQPPRVYSFVNSPATHRTLGARHSAQSSHWSNQLLTSQHQFSPYDVEHPAPTSAGLTGTLPLLLALVAFSCPRNHLSTALQQNVRLRRWVPHAQNIPHGRVAERGVVVSVWIDPDGNTDSDTLGKIESGGFGPFFSP